MRRNRNRLAAAKCRQKRLDQIADLQVEVAKWEMKNRSLEEEVASLREEKEELQYVLAAHRQSCTPHQHPYADQSLGHGQDQLQPQHPQLLLPAEEPHRGGPAQSQHPGTPLTVTSAQYASYTANIFYKDCPRIILSLSSLVVEKVYMYKIYVFIIKKKK